jgi:phosphatidylserine/phosphatidylglycerophosphate/cardiolipin synthase-like enzyme
MADVRILVIVFLLIQTSASPAAESSGQHPHDQEVCFSPDEHCDKQFFEFIGSAKESIDMAIYEITLRPLADRLKTLAKKKKVRVVVDGSEAKKSYSSVPLLIEAGVKVRYGRQTGRGIMHDKFTVVDGSMVETGSFNYTNGAVSINQENQIYVATPEVVSRFKERFQKMWESAKRPRGD